jgi:hypothetical protein
MASPIGQTLRQHQIAALLGKTAGALGRAEREGQSAR